MTDKLVNAIYELVSELERAGDVYVDPQYADLVKAANVLVREGIMTPAIPDRHFLYYVIRDS